jgi:hypothetical protein
VSIFLDISFSLHPWHNRELQHTFLCLLYALWNKFKVDKTMTIACSMSCYRHLHCRVHAPVNLRFLTALQNTSLSIHNVSEGNLCGKTQNVMFTRCPVASIFKCDEPTVCRKKHMTFNDNSAWDDRACSEVMS